MAVTHTTTGVLAWGVQYLPTLAKAVCAAASQQQLSTTRRESPRKGAHRPRISGGCSLHEQRRNSPPADKDGRKDEHGKIYLHLSGSFCMRHEGPRRLPAHGRTPQTTCPLVTILGPASGFLGGPEKDVPGAASPVGPEGTKPLRYTGGREGGGASPLSVRPVLGETRGTRCHRAAQVMRGRCRGQRVLGLLWGVSGPGLDPECPRHHGALRRGLSPGGGQMDDWRPKGPHRPVPVVPGPCEPEDLLDGVIFGAKYLGSTQLQYEKNPATNTRMRQAQEAVDRVKAPEGESQPMTEVDVMVSTQRVKVLTADSQEALMDHPLQTISYTADIGSIVVIMARRKSPRSQEQPSGQKRSQRMLCHVFQSADAQMIAQAIGQAFGLAYQNFLLSEGGQPVTSEVDNCL
ncbi:amyloid beta A4 precursor -binding family A member 3-like [Pelobates cultripes]|uniref:Amyloid beta A4 -binding family A member 3-like n=1 Tax=Pelobates cultripes TaxID=61616 RepID=A0AAD1RZL8_PELCU|nr:amyloid beta A4 precursor -binding family A member 3-like [Pelobates cultripes]